MGIDVALVDESHVPVQEVFDPRQVLTAFAVYEWPNRSATVSLQFIDPWGDTVFNQAQIPVLLAELKHFDGEQTDRDARKHLQKVIRLVELAVGQVHKYIKFIGD